MKDIILNEKSDLDGEYVKIGFNTCSLGLMITSQNGKMYTADIDREDVMITNEYGFKDLYDQKLFDTTHFEVENQIEFRRFLDHIFIDRTKPFMHQNFANIDKLDGVTDCKILLMSGGKDSTYLMDQLLKRGHYVCPVYNQFNDFGSVENVINKYCVANTIVKMANKYPGKIIPNFIDTFADCTKLKINPDMSYSYIQQPFNIFSLLLMDTRILKVSDEICFGHLSGDECAASWYDELNDLYKAVMKFNQIYNIDDLPEDKENIKLPKLSFPLQKMIKYDLLFRYKELQDDIDYTKRYTANSCERVQYNGCIVTKDNFNKDRLILNFLYEPCGNCNPCRLEKFLIGRFDENPNRWNKNYIVISIPFKNQLTEIKLTGKNSIFKKSEDKPKLTTNTDDSCDVEICDVEEIKEDK